MPIRYAPQPTQDGIDPGLAAAGHRGWASGVRGANMTAAMVDEPDAAAAAAWLHATGTLSLSRPRVMGVVNLTPDSFSDGGVLVAEGADTPNVSVAVRRVRQLVAEQADIIDLGGESTRPGSDPVSDARQLRRVLPVIERLAAGPDAVDVPLSIDTRSAAVAEAAMRAGASIINDVSGLSDPAMIAVAARSNAGLVVSHLRGEPRTMQDDVHFSDLLVEVGEALCAAVTRAVDGGVERARIVVDPGVGFGKSAEHSAALVAASAWLRDATGCPVLIGASRKSFMRSALASSGASDAAGRKANPRAHDDARLVGSLAAAVVAAERGAAVVRVHDVEHTVHALAVAGMVAQSWVSVARPPLHARTAAGEDAR